MSDFKEKNTGGRQLSEKIEKTTDRLLAGWEVNEDDFEDTQDMGLIAAQAVRLENDRKSESSMVSGTEKSSARSLALDMLDTGEWEEPDAGIGNGGQEPGDWKSDGSDAEKLEVDEDAVVAATAAALAAESSEHGTDCKIRTQGGGTSRPDGSVQRSNSNAAHSDGNTQRSNSNVQRANSSTRRSDSNVQRTYSTRTGSGKTRNSGSRRRRNEPSLLAFWNNLHPMDRIVGITGILVCLFAAVTFLFVLSDRSMTRQVDAFAEVGEDLEQIAVADESVFLAVADNLVARQQAAAAVVENETAEEETEPTEYNEKDDSSDIEVELKMTSVERDLKIKLVNKKSGKLIPHVPFEVEIKGPTSTITRVDEDKDGIIYLTDLKGGNFKVRVIGPKDVEGYILPEVGATITVKNEIEYKKIDVEEEIKAESEINAAVEDTQIKAEVESVITDTVEWVESTKTPVGGDEYVEVKKSDIPDPSATASLTFEKFAGVKSRSIAGTMFGFPSLKLATAGDDLSRTGNPPEGEESGDENSGDDSGSGSEGDSSDNSEAGGDSEGDGAEEDGSEGEGSEETGSGNQSISVTGVSVSPSQATLTVGDSTVLSASVSPENASDKTVSWSSSDSGVASVSGDGTVTAVSAGTATITVTTNDGGKTAAASVTVEAARVAVTGVSISGGNSVEVGKTLTLSAAVQPENASDKSVSWSSGNTAVATVDSSGAVTGVSAGKTAITVTTADGGKSASVEITVSAQKIAVTGVELSGADSVKAGESISLTAKVSPENATDKTVAWSSDNTAVATVDGSGKVTGVKAGTANITAKAGGKTAAKKITVTAAAAANSLTVNDMTLTAGKTEKASYKAEGKVSSASYSIEDTKYATVDSSGNIKAIRAGETKYTVAVKFEDGSSKSETKKLTIKAAAVDKITLDKASVTLKVGSSLKLNASVTTSGYAGCQWFSSDSSIVSVDENGTIKALKVGKATITVCAADDTSKKAACEVTANSSGTDPKNDTATALRDSSGRQLYIKDKNGKYVKAVVADYYKYDKFYRENEEVKYLYTGWQNLDGKRYYFDKNGNMVTGDQVIQGVKYSFGSDGSISTGAAIMGIDVSKHNGNINWTEVKNSGVNFVIIRCGYRGTATGVLVEDPKFKTNIEGALNAGLKVGIYFFSQAVNRVEAVEEASMTLALINKYKISYPVFMDVEEGGGRADSLDAAARTDVVNAFCQTIKNSGYTAGVYANKSWLNTEMNVGSFGSYKIWLAQYAAVPTYSGRYEMWQYSSTGRIGGISGNVDLNISYLGY